MKNTKFDNIFNILKHKYIILQQDTKDTDSSGDSTSTANSSSTSGEEMEETEEIENDTNTDLSHVYNPIAKEYGLEEIKDITKFNINVDFPLELKKYNRGADTSGTKVLGENKKSMYFLKKTELSLKNNTDSNKTNTMHINIFFKCIITEAKIYIYTFAPYNEGKPEATDYMTYINLSSTKKIQDINALNKLNVVDFNSEGKVLNKLLKKIKKKKTTKDSHKQKINDNFKSLIKKMNKVLETLLANAKSVYESVKFDQESFKFESQKKKELRNAWEDFKKTITGKKGSVFNNFNKRIRN